MTARPLPAAHITENIMDIARNVEVWILGAFGALVLAACLGGPSERPLPAAPVSAVAETELAQPQGAQPMYVVYVTARRLSPAEKRKLDRSG